MAPQETLGYDQLCCWENSLFVAAAQTCWRTAEPLRHQRFASSNRHGCQSAAVSRSAFLPAPKHSYVINIEWSYRWFKCANWAKHHFSWGSRNCAQRYTGQKKKVLILWHWTTQLPSTGGYREPLQDWWLVCRGPVRSKSLACWLHGTHRVCFFFFLNSYQTEGWKVASSFFENLIHHFLFLTATFKCLGWTGFKILQCCSVSPTRPFYRWGTSKSSSKDSLVDGWVVAASLACHGCSLLSSRTE